MAERCAAHAGGRSMEKIVCSHTLCVLLRSDMWERCPSRYVDGAAEGRTRMKDPFACTAWKVLACAHGKYQWKNPLPGVGQLSLPGRACRKGKAFERLAVACSILQRARSHRAKCVWHVYARPRAMKRTNSNQIPQGGWLSQRERASEHVRSTLATMRIDGMRCGEGP